MPSRGDHTITRAESLVESMIHEMNTGIDRIALTGQLRQLLEEPGQTFLRAHRDIRGGRRRGHSRRHANTFAPDTDKFGGPAGGMCVRFPEPARRRCRLCGWGSRPMRLLRCIARSHNAGLSSRPRKFREFRFTPTGYAAMRSDA